MKKNIAIIGGGASALVLACELDPKKFNVSLYEKNATLGRKFLVAGEGGLNFTHSEDSKSFISKYTPASFLQSAFEQFPNTEFTKWMNTIGVKTFVGSSGRLFPEKGMKPIQVLDKIREKIKTNKVLLFYKHTWNGFSDDGKLLMSKEGQEFEINPDVCVFCLGGATWSVTGSNGVWANHFQLKNIRVNSFQSSNCAFKVNWQTHLVSKLEGKILKNVSIKCAGKTHLGEIVLTKFGIEGSGIYPLSPQIRYELKLDGKAKVILDFKPNVSAEILTKKLKLNSENKNLTDRLKENLNLSPVQVTLLKYYLNKEDFLNETKLVTIIKAFEITISALAPLEEAISSIGGIDLSELTNYFELKKMKNNFVIGEMLDYDAPTGGYLLQSCFSMANYLASHLNSSFLSR